jgi:hypothetical protein
MDVLQQILNDAMASVPRLTLEKRILKKLQRQVSEDAASQAGRA